MRVVRQNATLGELDDAVSEACRPLRALLGEWPVGHSFEILIRELQALVERVERER